MSTTLCFDFGNTRMKCGVFTDGQFVEELVLEDDRDEASKVRGSEGKTQGCREGAEGWKLQAGKGKTQAAR